MRGGRQGLVKCLSRIRTPDPADLLDLRQEVRAQAPSSQRAPRVPSSTRMSPERCADDAPAPKREPRKNPDAKAYPVSEKADRQAEKRKMRCVGRKVIGKGRRASRALRVGPSAEKTSSFPRVCAADTLPPPRVPKDPESRERRGAFSPEPHTVRKPGLEQLLLFSVHQKKTPFCSSSSITSSPLRSTLYGVMINVPVETRLILPSFCVGDAAEEVENASRFLLIGSSGGSGSPCACCFSSSAMPRVSSPKEIGRKTTTCTCALELMLTTRFEELGVYEERARPPAPRGRRSSC